MPLLTRRLPALLLTLALSASHAALCAGWLATPQARMACCSMDGACPMHKSDSTDWRSRAVTQAEADSCCAASEQENSAPSASVSAFSVSFSPVFSRPVLPTAVAQPRAWRMLVPVPAAHVPKHLLLSVFLV
jgi:hypothetical protein